MKAWLLDRFEGLGQLRIADIPEATPAVNEAVLAIDFAGLNPADRHLAEGQYPAKPPLPHILGRDGIGTVVAVGSQVTTFKPGDRAIVLRSDVGVYRAGTFAEKVAVPVESLAPVPKGWTDQQAAGAALVYLTAWQALTQWGDLPPATAVLVTGASGGVGVAGIQLSAAMGYFPVALSRDEHKRSKLLEIGAKIALDPQDKNWPATLKTTLGEKRVGLAIDNIGGSLLPDVISTLGFEGKVSIVGRAAGPVPQFNTGTLFFRRIKMGGVAVGTYTPPQSQAAWKAVVETLAGANARPLVDSVFSFEKLVEAFGQLAKGPMGKVLVKIGGEG
jgi:NADPH:quinone reductase